MTKDDFVALVAEHGSMTKADASRAIGAFCGAVTAAMAKGEDVRLTGFGSFEVQQRGERQGRNVGTGEALMIAASKTVRFSAGTHQQVHGFTLAARAWHLQRSPLGGSSCCGRGWRGRGQTGR